MESQPSGNQEARPHPTEAVPAHGSWTLQPPQQEKWVSCLQAPKSAVVPTTGTDETEAITFELRLMTAGLTLFPGLEQRELFCGTYSLPQTQKVSEN